MGLIYTLGVLGNGEYNKYMNIKCTKCGGHNIFIEKPAPSAVEPKEITMDEFVDNMFQAVPAVYVMTTWKCGGCGYSVSR